VLVISDNICGETLGHEEVSDMCHLLSEISRIAFFRQYSLPLYFNLTFPRTADGKIFYESIRKVQNYAAGLTRKKMGDFISKLKS